MKELNLNLFLSAFHACWSKSTKPHHLSHECCHPSTQRWCLSTEWLRESSEHDRCPLNITADLLNAVTHLLFDVTHLLLAISTLRWLYKEHTPSLASWHPSSRSCHLVMLLKEHSLFSHIYQNRSRMFMKGTVSMRVILMRVILMLTVPFVNICELSFSSLSFISR